MRNTHTLVRHSIGLPEAIACVALMLLITNIIPFFFKDWFVAPTGNIAIAPFFGFAFALGIIFRQNWARHAAIFLFVIITFANANALLLAAPAQKPGFGLITLLTIILLGILVFSERLKQYMR